MCVWCVCVCKHTCVCKYTCVCGSWVLYVPCVSMYICIHAYCAVQSRFAVLRIPEWTASRLESTVSTLAEVSNINHADHR